MAATVANPLMRVAGPKKASLFAQAEEPSRRVWAGPTLLGETCQEKGCRQARRPVGSEEKRCTAEESADSERV